MCNPAVALVFTAALSVYQANEQNAAAKDQAAFQQKIASRNQALAETQAVDAMERGEREANLARQEGERVRAQQMAAFAANGLDVNVGSTVDVFATTEGLAEADALMIRANAEREATGFRNQGVNFGLQGQAAQFNYRQSRNATYLNAATQVSSSWYNYGTSTGNWNPFAGTGT